MLTWLISLFSERAAAEKDRRAHARTLYAKYLAAMGGSYAR